MFICGNDDAAKKTVAEILDQFGWETADMGRVEAARAIEPLCMLWRHSGLPSQSIRSPFQVAHLKTFPVSDFSFSIFLSAIAANSKSRHARKFAERG